YVVLEVREPQPDAVAPERLVHAEVVREARLRLEREVREPREEEVVEGRRAEARAGAATDARAPLLDQVGERAALCRVAAEHAVLLHAHAAGHVQPVEEPERLLEEAGVRVARRREDRRLLAPRRIAPVLEPERARGPLLDVEVIEPLELVP